MLKRLSLIILIVALAYCQVGYYFAMRRSQSMQKDVIKQQIFSKLKDVELDIISPDDNQQIYWEDEGKEFLFKGQMYDVVKTKIINGKVVLYCLNDKKEKELIDNYNLITKHNSSSDKKGKNNVDNSINLFVYQDEKNYDQYYTIAKNNFPYYISHLTESLEDNISPPPKA
ncbi:MAG: hypothetical protein ACR2KX_11365 [Chitinophagaceae bacterium]